MKPDCTCWSTLHRRCWQQTYTGLPCKHVIFVTLDRLRDSYCDKEERARICEAFVDTCHYNWLRSTYSGITVPHISKPVPVSKRWANSLGHDQLLLVRFREVLPFLPTAVVEDVLQQMEGRALEPDGVRQRKQFLRDSDSDSESDTSNEDSSDEPVPLTRRSLTRSDLASLLDPTNSTVSYKNPPLDRDRKRKRKR